MSEITTELKALRLHGMAGAWADLMTQGESTTASSRWLIEHLLQAETIDRAMRSVSRKRATDPRRRVVMSNVSGSP